MERIAGLHRALLVFHSPTDEIVRHRECEPYFFLAAKHPKSFVSLAGADHLLSRRSDAIYVATSSTPGPSVISTWLTTRLSCPEEPGLVVVRETRPRRFQQEVTVRRHRVPCRRAGRPPVASTVAPGPYDLLLAALGSLHGHDASAVRGAQGAAASSA